MLGRLSCQAEQLCGLCARGTAEQCTAICTSVSTGLSRAGRGSTLLVRNCLKIWRWYTFSSIVPDVISRYMVTSRVCTEAAASSCGSGMLHSAAAESAAKAVSRESTHKRSCTGAADARASALTQLPASQVLQQVSLWLQLTCKPAATR